MITRDKKELIPFLLFGFPTLAASEALAEAFIEEGCTVLEVGVPYSDPTADGPAIQRAATTALENGVHLGEVLGRVARLKTKYPTVRFVLFTYFNPLLKLGLANSLAQAKDSGIDAVLTVDLPLEEAGDYLNLQKRLGLNSVFLISPITPPSRAKTLAAASTEFVYYVSRAGVTGERRELSTSLGQELRALRALTERPLAVGFGISTPAHVRAAARDADAVVIGSRFISLLADSKDFPAGLKACRGLIREGRKALEAP